METRGQTLRAQGPLYRELVASAGLLGPEDCLEKPARGDHIALTELERLDAF